MKTYRIIYPRLEEQALAFKLKVDSTMAAAAVLDSIQAQQIAIRDQAAKVQMDRIRDFQLADAELRKEIRRQKRITLIVGIVGIIALVF